jgi:hypothetical protein
MISKLPTDLVSTSQIDRHLFDDQPLPQTPQAHRFELNRQSDMVPVVIGNDHVQTASDSRVDWDCS